MIYVETLPPTDIDETGFTARGRMSGASWPGAFDWANSPSLLPGRENEVETEAHHVDATGYETRGEWTYFSARIDSGPGIFYYRALYYSDGL